MSDTLVKYLETNPADLEHSLATAMRGIARRATERPEIVRALASADLLKAGYVIASEVQAVEIADLVAQVIEGEKALAEQIRLALRIPKQMEEAVKGAVEATKDRLANARQVGNAARVTWQGELRRQAAQAMEKARLEAQEAARRAAERAAETGEDAPPEAEVAVVEVPRVVSGGTGKMGTAIRIDPVEIVDYAKVPKEWLTLNTVAARSFFLAAVAARQIHKPEPGESIVHQGVRFMSVESAVNRR